MTRKLWKRATEWTRKRRYGAPHLTRFTFKSRKVIWPPAPKTILVALNLSADRVIEAIDDARFDHSESRSSLFDFEQISEIEWSVLLLEDRRFLIHSGVDFFRAVLRVSKQMMLFRRIGGISTIEQQLVRTILDDRRRNLARKCRESIVANAISYRKLKFDILRSYLRYAYFGYRLKGADAAARKIFGCSARSLSATQADFIACLLVYPLPKQAQIPPRLPGLPALTPEEILAQNANSAPRWASRIKRRYLYAAHLRTYSVKPLYQIH